MMKLWFVFIMLLLAGNSEATVNKYHEEQTVEVQTMYNAVASSAASLDLPYCGEGVSAQGKDGGLGVTNTNFICESKMALDMVLILAKTELQLHDRTHSQVPQHVNYPHLTRAHEYMMEAEGILIGVLHYVNTRQNTAGIGATSKDLVWPAVFLGLLIWLL